MFDWLQTNPGRLYVVGTLLPLAAFVLLLLAGSIRSLCRPFRQQGGFAARLYWAFGGDTPVRTGAVVTVVCMALSAVCAAACSKSTPASPTAVAAAVSDASLPMVRIAFTYAC